MPLRPWIGRTIAKAGEIANHRVLRQQTELIALTELAHNLRTTGFPVPIFPGGYAASATLLNEYFRYCERIMPRRVLECGAGQSSLLSRHYAVRNPSCQVVTLEDDRVWIQDLEPTLSAFGDCGNHQVIESPLADAGEVGSESYRWYSGPGAEDALATGGFDVVVVDGPSGRHRGARIGIADHIPRILSKSFVLLFDDAQNRFVRIAIARSCKGLKEAGISFVQKCIDGSNTQLVVASSDLSSLVSGRLVEEPWPAEQL